MIVSESTFFIWVHISTRIVLHICMLWLKVIHVINGRILNRISLLTFLTIKTSTSSFYKFFLFHFFWEKADMPTSKHRRQLTTWQVFCQVERRFHNRDSNRQLGKDFVDTMSSKIMKSRQGFHSLQTHCVHKL